MAKSDGTVYINTLVDTKGFGKGMNTMQKQVGGLSGAIGKLGAAIAATFAVSKLIQFGKEAIDLGSDLQEVQNVVDVTFTTMSDKVDEFAKGAAEAAGLSEVMAKRYTGTFGAMAKAFGFAEGEAFNMSTSLTQLAGDVASFYNITQDEAYTKLKSVFTGETETLKDLGVVMTQNALDTYAMAEGYGKTTKEMSEQEKVALRYAFVLDRLSAASGDFARTSDSWANQTRILQLNVDSLKANIGQALINIFTPLLKVINQVVSKMAQLSQYFIAFSEMIVGKSTSGGGGSPGEALAEIEDGYEGITDATEDAEKANKKYLSSYDDLNLIAFSDVENTDTQVGSVDLGEIEASSNAIDDVVASFEELEKKFPKTTAFLKKSSNLVKDIFEDFKTGDFFEAGQDISELTAYIFDSFSEAIEDVDWDELGEKIGDFLAGIDWLKVIKSGIKLKFNIWKAIAEVWFGSYQVAPLETAILTAIMALKFTPLGGILGTAIKNALVGGSLATAISGALASVGGIGGLLMMDMGIILGAGSLAEIGLLIGSSIIGGIVAAIAGFSIGQWLYEVISGEEIDMSWAEQFDAIKESFSDGSWKDALSLWGEDIGSAFTELGNSIDSWWNEDVVTWWNEDVKEFFSKEKWSEAMEGIKEAFEEKWGGAINVAIALFNKFIGYLNDKMHFQWEAKEMFGHEIFPAGNIQLFTIPKIPYLATGAVIPPNAPFMAMLGDQKHGTNIEAPLDTIKQGLAEVLAEMGINVTFEVEGDEAGIFKVTQRQAKMYTKRTNKPAYPTGG